MDLLQSEKFLKERLFAASFIKNVTRLSLSIVAV